MPQLDDTVRIQHMIEAAEKAVEFVAGRNRSALDDDEMLRLSLVKLVEIIGEAAKHVSVATRHVHPAVPWSSVARMRDRLVHHHFEINLDVRSATVTVELLKLLEVVPRSGSQI
jgi:uncharacterized protein with HEPN domain